MEIKIDSVAEMVAIERQADAGGLPYARMMENAGRNLAGAVQSRYGSLASKAILGLVGSGNNGGDSLVALAQLCAWGWRSSAYLLKPRPGDALVERLRQAGGLVLELENDQALVGLEQALAEHSILLDGVLGTGFKLPLAGEARRPVPIHRSPARRSSR